VAWRYLRGDGNENEGVRAAAGTWRHLEEACGTAAQPDQGKKGHLAPVPVPGGRRLCHLNSNLWLEQAGGHEGMQHRQYAAVPAWLELTMPLQIFRSNAL